jgi:hypothetical protein
MNFKEVKSTIILGITCLTLVGSVATIDHHQKQKEGSSKPIEDVYEDEYIFEYFEIIDVIGNEYFAKHLNKSKSGGIYFTSKKIYKNKVIKEGDKVKGVFDAHRTKLITVEKVNK